MSSGDTTPATGTGGAIGAVRRDGRTDPFFDGAARDVLVIRRCAPCGRWYAPDTGGCPECGADEPAWAEADGTAVLVSWAVAHPRRGEPAPLALVELAEGPWMYARLRGVAEPRAGLPLRAVFVHPDEGESYPVFEALPGGSASAGEPPGPGAGRPASAGTGNRTAGGGAPGGDAGPGPAPGGTPTPPVSRDAGGREGRAASGGGDGVRPRAGERTGGTGEGPDDDRDDLRGTP